MNYRHWIAFVSTMSLTGICSLAQPATNLYPNASELWSNEFVFLPGGFRTLAKTISATNETFRLSLFYIGATRAGHRPAHLPEGVTQLDISNAQFQIFTWSGIVPPKPLSFYGKIVDENGQPVAGATVHFAWDGTVTNRNAMEFRDWPKIWTNELSDSNGFFLLTNKFGTELDVSVSKPGYYSSRTNLGAQYFQYSVPNIDSSFEFFRADSNHPVVYYLRKGGVGANTLVTSRHGLRTGFWINAQRDGTPVSVDLITEKTGIGPLEIIQKKPDFPAHGGTIESLSPSDRAKLMSATNWSFSMKISDGGFIEETEEFPFTPPESGYHSVVKYDFQKGQTNWTVYFQKDYYIKFGSPALYGQLHLETWADSGYVILKYLINPDGSRNLEPK